MLKKLTIKNIFTVLYVTITSIIITIIGLIIIYIPCLQYRREINTIIPEQFFGIVPLILLFTSYKLVIFLKEKFIE